MLMGVSLGKDTVTYFSTSCVTEEVAEPLELQLDVNTCTHNKYNLKNKGSLTVLRMDVQL